MSRFLPDDSRCDGLKVRICSCYSFAGNCITQMLRSLQVLYRLMSVCVNVFVFLLFSVLWVGWFGAWGERPVFCLAICLHGCRITWSNACNDRLLSLTFSAQEDNGKIMAMVRKWHENGTAICGLQAWWSNIYIYDPIKSPMLSADVTQDWQQSSSLFRDGRPKSLSLGDALAVMARCLNLWNDVISLIRIEKMWKVDS